MSTKKSRFARASEILAKKAEVGKRNINQFTGDLFTTGTAVGIGYLRGRFPEQMRVGDTEIEIPIVIATKGLAFFNAFGETASHALHGAGTGTASALGTLYGYQLGQRHRAEDAVRMGQAAPMRERVAA